MALRETGSSVNRWDLLSHIRCGGAAPALCSFFFARVALAAFGRFLFSFTSKLFVLLFVAVVLEFFLWSDRVRLVVEEDFTLAALVFALAFCILTLRRSGGA